jgi:hypothetical protein
MAKHSTKRKPNLTLRMILMLLLTLLIVGGLFAVKGFIGAQTNKFFDNMPGARRWRRSARWSRSTAPTSPPRPAA